MPPDDNGRRRPTFCAGLLIGLVIVGPTFLVEETWNGKPLIDQGGHRWVLPAIVMAVGFFVAGLLVGRYREDAVQAFGRGVLVAAVITGLTFLADVARRDALGKITTPAIEDLWFIAAILAVLVGGLGGIAAYRRTIRRSRSGA